jgi:soluble lytic murein transglycosylase-like protein
VSPLALTALAIMVVTMLPKPRPVAAPRRKPLERMPPDRKRMIAIITSEAKKQGVPVPVALAFADAESGLNPDANGDLGWSDRHDGALYKRFVLNNPKLARNPARMTPRDWHAYGLYQLLAPYHTGPGELPSLLYDPQINAQRGIAEIKKLLRVYADIAEARLRYTGLTSHSDPAAIDRVLTRFAPIYQQWSKAT